MNQDLPFNVEYAKSGRASCKKCRENIAKDSLRMGIMVQSAMFDGKMPLWHHLHCFFAKKTALKSTDEIANFQNLRWEDQEKVKLQLAGCSKNGVGDNDSSNSDFSVEYAKSSRSGCKGCSEKILKGEVRISKLDRDNPETARYGPTPQWHHVDCFVQRKEELEFTESADNLPGYKSLLDDDKEMLRQKLGKGVKRKTKDPGPTTSKLKKSVRKEDHALKTQNDTIFQMRDNLKANFSKKDMIHLLELNEQHVSHGESSLLDHLTDCLLFGALKTCPDCKNARPRYKLNAYYCPGDLTEWTKCDYNTKYPEREAFVVPEEFREDFDFLKNYKYAKKERLFPEITDVGSSKPSLPLADFNIALIGKLKVAQDVIQRGINELGGTVQKTVNASVNLCIANQTDVGLKSTKMNKIKNNNVHVVTVDFIDSVRKGTSPAVAIKDNLICTWGDDPILKFGIKKEKTKKEELADSRFSKSFGKSGGEMKVKITVTGAAAVDPDSGLDSYCHVYQKNGNIYNAVLGYVDIQRGTNSYYKLQLIESNHGKKFYVFRSWGRVGTSIGKNKLENMSLLEEAITSFEAIYLDKTGNYWWNRKDFKKKPGFMYPLDIDYGQEDQATQVLKPGANSKLDKPVQELICLIFDIEAMKQAMVEFELDLKKMPLGKLSKSQIQLAYKVLCEAQEVLQTGSNRAKIMDASNRFFTLIPHDFGLRKPPLLDDNEIIKSKIEMLESLLEIEYAYNLIKGEQGIKSTKDPVDEHYEKLKTDIEVVNKHTTEYQNIEKYLMNTHAATHDYYNLKLNEVFKINRHGEKENYQEFKNLHNKKLLWHGSRLTNYVGILSQGLRIAPPEAPPTGYMFGKGVYFADMVSKSANYCFTSRSNSTGLLLLCEVALGNMYEKEYSEYVEKLPKNKHSTKGLGQTAPDPSDKMFMDDVEVPFGKPVASDIKQSSLLYNEYIVYNTNQINIKYLLNVNFKHKY